jgi:hypothetical protein
MDSEQTDRSRPDQTNLNPTWVDELSITARERVLGGIKPLRKTLANSGHVAGGGPEKPLARNRGVTRGK